MQNPQLLTLVCFYIYLDLTLIGSQSVALHIYWGGGGCFKALVKHSAHIRFYGDF